MAKRGSSHPHSRPTKAARQGGIILESDPAGYVDLGRRFLEFDDTESTEAAVQSSYLDILRGHVDGWGWSDLLERRIVVILGEPGSGKSYELRHRRAALVAAGEEAFLIELERLVHEPLEEILSADEGARFACRLAF